MRNLFASVATLALVAAAPAMAADYILRPSVTEDWGQADQNPLRIETGIRYWYSIGQHNLSTAGFDETIDTKTSSGEAFVRIDDFSTQTYLEAVGGYGVAHEGTTSTNGGAAVDIEAARLGYIGADYGWLPFGNETAGVGFVTGYQYMMDSPDTGRTNFYSSPTVVSTGVNTWAIGGGQDSEINNFDIHTLKLGLAGRADFGNFDVQAEAAAIPYSWVNGTHGTVGFSPAAGVLASATMINGHAYGATGKMMVGFHPTENLTIRLGGRASYLTGQYDAEYEGVTLVPNANPAIAPTLNRQRYISDNNPFSMLRYGALVEVSGRF